MHDEEQRRTWITLLQAVDVCQSANEPLNVPALARDVDRSEDSVEHELELLEHRRLALTGEPPVLLNAGRQYLAREGRVPHAVLSFLPRSIDDLDARAALLTAGTILVDEFRGAILAGRGAEHAVELVPPAFAAAVDDRLALGLYSAAVALMARLSSGDPAGCVAEEIMAVALIEQAQVGLEMATELGELSPEDAAAADDALRDLFELFEDDDVLDLFDMEEPADAAVAAHDAVNRQLGVVDQRVEAWFQPFGWTAPTGYLAAEQSNSDSDSDRDD